MNNVKHFRNNARYLRVKLADLPNLFAKLVRATLITFHAETIPAIRKTGNDGTTFPLWAEYKEGRVVKLSQPRGTVYWKYRNSVRNQQRREGLPVTFEPKDRKWGHRLDKSNADSYSIQLGRTIAPNPALVGYIKDDGFHYYLELKVGKSGPYRYVLINRDGSQTELSKEMIDNYLKPIVDPGIAQGVKQGIYCRDYDLSNIRKIHCTFPSNRPGQANRQRTVYTVVR